MRNSLPPLNWLRTFEAAARHRSFTHAASELNMTQSAVSQQIKALEGHMGRRLFHRGARTLDLTETGLSYLPIVRDAFRTLTRGTLAVTGGSGKAVRIHANMSFATFWIAPRLPRFYAQNPDVQLEFIVEVWEPEGMAQGADIELRYSVRPTPGLPAEKLADEMVFPVAPPGWTGTLKDARQSRLFDVSNLTSTWISWAEDQGLDWSDVTITWSSAYALTLNAAMSGAGLALANTSVAGHLLQTGQLIRPFEHSAPMQGAYYMIEAPHARDLPGARAFADWIRSEMMQDHRGGSQGP